MVGLLALLLDAQGASSADGPLDGRQAMNECQFASNAYLICTTYHLREMYILRMIPVPHIVSIAHVYLGISHTISCRHRHSLCVVESRYRGLLYDDPAPVADGFALAPRGLKGGGLGR